MRFDQAVKPGGYAWWYVDAISDDGAHALTLIAFIGSVFSPYYAWANAKQPAPAENFCAMNVALYGRRKGWAMTERGQRCLSRREDCLAIGRSRLTWEDGSLAAEIDEVTVPIPRRLRGRFKLRPDAIQNQVFSLDAAGRHRWRPIAPASRIEVAFDHPGMSWSGRAYFDMNEGDAPLADDFASWHWSRSAAAGDAAVLYDVTRRDGTQLALALNIGPDGVASPFAAPAMRALPKTRWGVRRMTRADDGITPRIINTLEDAPFYARSHIETRMNGVTGEAIHESLNMERFSTKWVKLLLPFRMPRRG
jgi:carotenoid 1,2-hydratase